MAEAILECKGVDVSFGGVRALKSVDFVTGQGVLAAIIGPNGAGKTTLLNAISGFVPMQGGAINFKGGNISGFAAHKRGRAGIVRTFQNLQIFSNMTVMENIITGMHRLMNYNIVDSLLKTPRYRRVEKECLDRTVDLLNFVGLENKSEALASELPFGNLRLLELARALAAKPEILMLDEPAAGLNITETRELGVIIKKINEELGVTIVLVEHDMDLVMNISHIITVLNFGEVIARGEPSQIQKDPAVIKAYLGEEDEESQVDEHSALG